jgi:hypothetical protein
VLNSIDISSTIEYNVNKEKLKLVLEKRKECFNDLEEFRKDWEIKLREKEKIISRNSKES